MSSLISQWAHAILEWVSPNESGLNQLCDEHGKPTWDDPVKLRMGAYRPRDGRKHFYLGIWGGDILTKQGSGSPHRDERAFVAIKHDNNDGQQAVPCFEFYAQRTAESTSDADMLCLARLSSKGLELDPKHQAPNMQITVRGVPVGSGGGSGGVRVTRFYTDGGKFLINWQDDTGEPSGIVYETATGEAVGRVPIQMFK